MPDVRVLLLELLVLYCIVCMGNAQQQTQTHEHREKTQFVVVFEPFVKDETDYRNLAAALIPKELRRYIYVTTGQLPVLLSTQSDGPQATAFDIQSLNLLSRVSKVTTDPDARVIFALTSKSPNLYKTLSAGERTQDKVALLQDVMALRPDQHILRSVQLTKTVRAIFCVGYNILDTLYAVYSFAEGLGVRFYLHGDVLPSEPLARLPEFNRTFCGVFQRRGIQPFHDFPEGPDWWSADDYKVHISQMVKMKMNFIGLHTYPLYEPTVWVGTVEDFDPNGNVKKSYQTSYMNSLRGDWGYLPMNTSDYSFGAWQIYAADCATGNNPVLEGVCPRPQTPDQFNLVFDRTAHLLRDAFDFAHKVGVKTCVGTEVPLLKPDESISAERYYAGTFQRAEAAYDIDYYWLWTPEDWEWQKFNISNPQVKQGLHDLLIAFDVWNKSSLQNSFQLATCGWEIGPLPDQAWFDYTLPPGYTLSSLDQYVGDAPVNSAYGRIQRLNKWVIPWMEDDPGLLVAELWVNRTMEHAFAAFNYSCSGLMGLFWRTVVTAPQLASLSMMAWDITSTSDQLWLDFATANFGTQIAVEAAKIFISVDSDKLPRPVDWTTGPGGMVPNNKPWSQVADSYIFVDQFSALRRKVVGLANLARFDYWDHTFKFMREVAHISCKWGEINAAFDEVYQYKNPEMRKKVAEQLLVPLTGELVGMWGAAETYLLQTVTSTGEMGTVMNFQQHAMPTVVTPTLKKLDALLGYLGCYNDESVNRDLNGAKTSSKAMTQFYCIGFCRESGFAYAGVQDGSKCYCGNSFGKYGEAPYQQCNVNCSGDSNNYCGGNSSNSIFYTKSVLPSWVRPSKAYRGPSRLIVPTVRTTLVSGETLNVRVMILSSTPLTSLPILYYRPIGGIAALAASSSRSSYTSSSPPNFSSISFRLTTPGRQVYDVSIPNLVEDIEYYIQAEVPTDVGESEINRDYSRRLEQQQRQQQHETLAFPPDAPQTTQTVVVF